MKRLFDISVAGVALVLLSPLLLIVALAVRLTMGRPVLFRQRRPGLHGEPFELVKFRTMRQPSGADIAVAEDELRLTRLGRFLRRIHAPGCAAVRRWPCACGTSTRTPAGSRSAPAWRGDQPLIRL